MENTGPGSRELSREERREARRAGRAARHARQREARRAVRDGTRGLTTDAAQQELDRVLDAKKEFLILKNWKN